MAVETWIVSALACVSAMALGGAVVAGGRLRRAPVTRRMEELSNTAQPQAAARGGFLERLGRAAADKPSAGLQQELAESGFHSRVSPAVYLGAKMMLALSLFPLASLGVLMLELPTLSRAALALCVTMLGFFLPNVYVSVVRGQRRGEIRFHLPDAVDLLEISVSAGMGLDQAWNGVAGEIRHVSGLLADEMSLASLEMNLGASRSSALRHMAKRTGSDELSSLVSILVESERFGTSTAEALRTFANTMREKRSLRAQEFAEKMAVKMIFPLVLFIFPPVLVVVAGPAFISIVRTLGR